ncbi:MAG: hypothetical protein M0Q54_12685 [Pigmentiphaga sp.]|nr:hypothetical protein [Pigmentiphaga sp.]
MHCVALDGKLTDSLERELVRQEVSQSSEQPFSFSGVNEMTKAILQAVRAMKIFARRYKVEFMNG